MTEPHASFWAFSLLIYAKPGVAEACLELQDEFDADVNLLLFMLWLGYQGRRLSAQEIEAIVDLVKPWQEGVVRPLRLARRALKSADHDWQSEEAVLLRQRVKADELSAERVQQHVLEAYFRENGLGESEGVLAATKSNLNGYATLIHAAFPDVYVSVLKRSILDGD